MPSALPVPLNGTIHFDEVTSNPTTGEVSDADSAPTFAVFEEDNDTDLLSAAGVMIKRVGLTGNYKGSFTVSAANGFEVGKFYNVVTEATVNSITAKTRSLTFRVVRNESIVGVPRVDVEALDASTTAVLKLKFQVQAIERGQAQGVVPANNQITLESSNATDNYDLTGMVILMVSGLGTSQTRRIE